jgi:hypothetical protein
MITFVGKLNQFSFVPPIHLRCGPALLRRAEPSATKGLIVEALLNAFLDVPKVELLAPPRLMRGRHFDYEQTVTTWKASFKSPAPSLASLAKPDQP